MKLLLITAVFTPLAFLSCSRDPQVKEKKLKLVLQTVKMQKLIYVTLETVMRLLVVAMARKKLVIFQTAQ